MNGAFDEKPHFCVMKNLVSLLVIAVLTFSCVNMESTDNQEPLKDTTVVSKNPRSKADQISLAIRERPRNPDLYFKRAEAYVEEQMLLLAFDDINRALSLDSTNAVYHAYKGEIQYMQRDPSAAVESFKKSLELDSKNTDALLKMAEIKLLLRQYQDCFDMANAALRVNDQLFMAYYIKGYAHYELGDSNLFVSSVQTALELNPQFFDGYTMLGSFYSSLGSELALDYFNSALDIKPEDDGALYGKAIFLQNQERYEEAMELYKYMVELDNENTLAWHNQGYIHLEVHDDPEKAIPFFKKALNCIRNMWTLCII